MQSMATKLQQLSIFAGVMVLSAWLAGCTGAAQSKPQGPPQVSVAEVACRQFTETDEFTGRLEAVNTVEVRPRVSGYLQSVNFQEGAIVRQGTLLFQSIRVRCRPRLTVCPENWGRPKPLSRAPKALLGALTGAAPTTGGR